MNHKLPPNWSWVKLGEVCDKLTDGSHYSPKSVSEGLPYVTVKDLTSDRINFDDCKRITKKEYLKLVENDCNPKRNDVLFSKDGTVGKVSLINFDKEFVVLSSLAILRPNTRTIFPKYLFHFLKSSTFLNQALSKKKGVAIRRIILRDLKELNVSLPPLPEQKKIVAKIEELFSELDNGIEQIKKAKQQLKIYRQGVLSWAFSGKLLRQRVQGKAHRELLKAAEPEVEYGTSRNLRDKGNGLPEGWKWKTLKEVTSNLGDGLHGTPKYTSDGDYYFINGNNLSEGKIELKNSKRVSLEEYEKHKKPLNDRTVFVSINGTLGKTAFYNNEKIILGKSACYFNLNDNADKRYVRYYITTQQFLNYANKTATGSTIKNVSLKAMREFEIPLPSSISEQHQIVSEIESRFSVADKLEQTIDENLKKSKTLRQSILKKAFEGRLI